MLEQLQVKVDETLHKETKNICYAQHLLEIDRLVKEVKEIYPTFIPDNLVIRLTNIAEKNSEEMATLMINNKNMIKDIIKEEVDLFKKSVVVA